MTVAWLSYAGAVGALGLAWDGALIPPGIVYLVGPAVLLVATVAGSAMGRDLARSVPVAVILGFQAFRAGVELTLAGLREAGLVPRLLTLDGGNVEILVALTAPVAAWLATRGPAGRRLALGWNVLGLLSLANVVTRSVLTAPGPLHAIDAEVPNLAMGLFPFTFVPGFMAPLAALLHILAFRTLRTARTTDTATDLGVGQPVDG